MKVGVIWLALVVALCVYAFQSWPASEQKLRPAAELKAVWEMADKSAGDGNVGVTITGRPFLHVDMAPETMQPPRPWLIADGAQYRKSVPVFGQIVCGQMWNAVSQKEEYRCIGVASK